MITAVVSCTVQTGMDEFTTYHHAKQFSEDDSVKNILCWASNYIKDPKISEIILCETDA